MIGDSKSQAALANYLHSALEQHFQNNALFQEAKQISHASLQELYEKAYLLYQEKKGEEASVAFGILIALDPFSYPFWMGLAASRQMNNEFERALQAFAIASLLDDQDPAPHYHAAQCYLALKNEEEARKAIDLADALTRAHPIHESFKERINQLRTLFSCQLRRSL